MNRVRGGALAAVVLLAAAACSSSPSAAPGPDTAGGSTGTGSTTSSRPSPPGTPPGSLPGAPVDFGKPGPYKVGMRRLTMGATNVVVYYPAATDGLDRVTHVTSYSSGEAFAPALRAMVAALVPAFVQDIPIDAYQDARINSEGPFPVVIHSHGFGGFYLFGSQHFSQEASWGLVVAAPDHPSRDLSAVAANKVLTAGDPDVADLTATLHLLEAQNADPASPLEGGLDTAELGAEGHSAGGRASYLFAVQTPAVKVWIGQAPSDPISYTPADDTLPPDQEQAAEKARLATAPALGRPAMIVQGEKDSVVALAEARTLYDWLAPPKRLMVVSNSGHAGFLDVCKPIRDQGGLEQYAAKLPAFAPLFKLGDDGCGKDNIDPAEASAFVNHVMIAQYRLAFGEDTSDASLSPAYLERTFPTAYAAALSASDT
jgi:pimeloyl-ACP methyl ester carboxylesterase